jgi:hypothetical protein
MCSRTDEKKETIPMEEKKQQKKGQIHFHLNNFLRVIQLDLILFKSTTGSCKEEKKSAASFYGDEIVFPSMNRIFFLLYIPEKIHFAVSCSNDLPLFGCSGFSERNLSWKNCDPIKDAFSFA